MTTEKQLHGGSHGHFIGIRFGKGIYFNSCCIGEDSVRYHFTARDTEKSTLALTNKVNNKPEYQRAIEDTRNTCSVGQCLGLSKKIEREELKSRIHPGWRVLFEIFLMLIWDAREIYTWGKKIGSS